jgi:hypothetical protein
MIVGCRFTVLVLLQNGKVSVRVVFANDEIPHTRGDS